MAASAKAKTVIGRVRTIPFMPGSRSCPTASMTSPAHRNIDALAMACESAWKIAPLQAPAAQGWAAEVPPASGKTKKR